MKTIKEYQYAALLDVWEGHIAAGRLVPADDVVRDTVGLPKIGCFPEMNFDGDYDWLQVRILSLMARFLELRHSGLRNAKSSQ